MRRHLRDALRMKRRLLNFATSLSLLLCAATAVLWGRSHRRYEYVQHVGETWVHEASSDRGLLIVGYERVRYGDRGRRGWSAESLKAPNRPINWYSAKRYPKPWYRFGLHPPRYIDSIPAWDAAIPYWGLFLITALLPATWLLRWRRQARRASAGLCPACGYDLRATPGRCPECGAAATVSEP